MYLIISSYSIKEGDEIYGSWNDWTKPINVLEDYIYKSEEYCFYVYFINTLKTEISYKIKSNDEWIYIKDLLMDDSDYKNNEIIVTDDGYYFNGEYKTKHENNKIIIKTNDNTLLLECDIVNTVVSNKIRNILCGKGTEYDFKGKKIYEGVFKYGKYEGRGILYYKNYKIFIKEYEGDFKDGKYDGKGIKYYYGNKINYEGEFTNGKYNGTGIEYSIFNGKKIYDGEFLNGKYEGKGIKIF